MKYTTYSKHFSVDKFHNYVLMLTVWNTYFFKNSFFLSVPIM
jgi:hypothetical protein